MADRGSGDVDGLASGEPDRIGAGRRDPEPLGFTDQAPVAVRCPDVVDGAVRSHRGRADRPLGPDRERHRAVGRVDAVQVVVVGLAFAEVARGDDEERAAVRVPGRRRDGAGGTGQRGVHQGGTGVGDVDDHELLRLVEQVPRAVDVEVEPGDEPRRLGVRSRATVTAGDRRAGAAGFGEACGHRDPCRVGGPDGVAGAEGERGDDARLAAVHRCHGELWVGDAVVVVDGPEEGEPATVR